MSEARRGNDPNARWTKGMNTSDWAIICATLLGPVLAVQAQKWVERATESRRRRKWIFETIMSNVKSCRESATQGVHPVSRQSTPAMVATIGIDLGKNTFHLVGLVSAGTLFCS
jgi:hypothetical protein